MSIEDRLKDARELDERVKDTRFGHYLSKMDADASFFEDVAEALEKSLKLFLVPADKEEEPQPTGDFPRDPFEFRLFSLSRSIERSKDKLVDLVDRLVL